MIKELSPQEHLKLYSESYNEEGFLLEELQDYGLASQLVWHREELEKTLDNLTEEEKAALEQADRLLFRNAALVAEWCRLDFVYPYLREGKPLEHWWQYLDLVAEGSYPADLLPDYLKDLYQEAA